MANERAKVYYGLLKAGTDDTITRAGKAPESNRLKQAREGGSHPLWLLGHLANSLNVFVVMWVGGEKAVTPREYGKIFMPESLGGDPITGNAADYPSWDEVFQNYQAAAAKATEIVKGLSDDDIAAALKGNVPEQYKEMFGNTEKTLGITITHDSHHRGQMALLAAM